MFFVVYLNMEKLKSTIFDPMAIGKEIRRVRRELNISQKELVDMVNKLGEAQLSQREVSQMENGKGNPTLKKLEAIEKALGREFKLK